jgi:hypothetical protein
MEEDFEELYDLYGDKLRMHPLVRIPIRTCMMVYMVHLTNQMVQKSPIPNIDQILKTNPDIARQLATAAMQSQSVPQRQPNSNSGGGNPLDGLANFMSSMVPPPPQQRPQVRSPIKIATRPQAPQPQMQMKPPSLPPDISDLLKSVGVPQREEKKVSLTPTKKGGSTGKNSVSIKL